MSKQVIYNDLTGGINNLDTKETLNSSTKKTETPDMMNVEYYGIGGIKTMDGNTQLGPTLEDAVVGGWEYVKGNQKFMIIALQNGKIKLYNAVTNSYDDIFKFNHISDKVSFCNMNNGVVISNGIDDLLFYEHDRQQELYGNVNIENGANLIKGVSTKFKTELKVGDFIEIESASGQYEVVNIKSDTEIEISPAITLKQGKQYYGFTGSIYRTAITKSSDDFSVEQISPYYIGTSGNTKTSFKYNGNAKLNYSQSMSNNIISGMLNDSNTYDLSYSDAGHNKELFDYVSDFYYIHQGNLYYNDGTLIDDEHEWLEVEGNSDYAYAIDGSVLLEDNQYKGLYGSVYVIYKNNNTWKISLVSTGSIYCFGLSRYNCYRDRDGLNENIGSITQNICYVHDGLNGTIYGLVYNNSTHAVTKTQIGTGTGWGKITSRGNSGHISGWGSPSGLYVYAIAANNNLYAINGYTPTKIGTAVDWKDVKGVFYSDTTTNTYARPVAIKTNNYSYYAKNAYDSFESFVTAGSGQTMVPSIICSTGSVLHGSTSEYHGQSYYNRSQYATGFVNYSDYGVQNRAYFTYVANESFNLTNPSYDPYVHSIPIGNGLGTPINLDNDEYIVNFISEQNYVNMVDGSAVTIITLPSEDELTDSKYTIRLSIVDYDQTIMTRQFGFNYNSYYGNNEKGLNYPRRTKYQAFVDGLNNCLDTSYFKLYSVGNKVVVVDEYNYTSGKKINITLSKNGQSIIQGEQEQYAGKPQRFDGLGVYEIIDNNLYFTFYVITNKNTYVGNCISLSYFESINLTPKIELADWSGFYYPCYNFWTATNTEERKVWTKLGSQWIKHTVNVGIPSIKSNIEREQLLSKYNVYVSGETKPGDTFTYTITDQDDDTNRYTTNLNSVEEVYSEPSITSAENARDILLYDGENVSLCYNYGVGNEYTYYGTRNIEIDTINDSESYGTTNLLVNLADISKCNAYLVNTDKDSDPAGSVYVPIRGLAIQYYAGRLWVGGEDGLFYSAVGLPNNWDIQSDAGAIYDIYNDSSKVTALGVWSEYLIVHKEYSTYLLSCTGEATTIEIKPYSNITCESQQGWIVSNTKYFLFSKEFLDIYPLVQRTIFNDKFLGEPVSNKIRNIFKTVDVELSNYIYCVSRPKERQMLFYLPLSISQGSSFATVFDFQTKSWLFRKVPQVVKCAFNFKNDIYIGTNDGKVLKEFSGNSFDGMPINAYYKSPWFDWMDGYSQSFAEFCIEVNTDERNIFNIDTIKDGNSRTEVRTIDTNILESKSLVWGSNDTSEDKNTMKWDENKWLRTAFETIRMLLPNNVFEDFQFRLFTDKIGQLFKVFKYGFRRIEAEEAPW